MSSAMRIGPLVGAGLVLGVGLGGFVDGILLHQILQWHNMLSSVTPPTDLVAMKYNMVWDGVFHALTWSMCAIGVGLLFRAGRRADVPWSGRLLLGSMLGGWDSSTSSRGSSIISCSACITSTRAKGSSPGTWGSCSSAASG